MGSRSGAQAMRSTDIDGAARPVRLQLSRKKGFDLQAHSRAVNGLPAANVARPGIWGNPWPISEAQQYLDDAGEIAEAGNAPAIAVDWYRTWITGTASQGKYLPPTRTMIRDRLRSHNLACWCALCPEHATGKPFAVDCTNCAPCHADVLGRIVCDTPPAPAPTAPTHGATDV